MFDGFLQDLRYGIRSLTARPAFAIAALLTLALAIGANTLVFSLIDGIYLTPLPYRDDASLVDVENRYPSMGLDTTGESIPDYLDRRAGVPALAESALYTNDNFNLAIEGAPERVHGIRATPTLFATLGVSPSLGRAFNEDEAQTGTDRVVVLGDAMWKNRFNADPGVVGRDIRLNGESYRIVGVMPAGFMFPNRETALYVPFAFTEKQKSDLERGFEFSTSIARLAPGATLADVKQQCDLVIRRNLDRIGAIGGDGASFAQFMKSAGFTVTNLTARVAVSAVLIPIVVAGAVVPGIGAVVVGGGGVVVCASTTPEAVDNAMAIIIECLNMPLSWSFIFRERISDSRNANP